MYLWSREYIKEVKDALLVAGFKADCSRKTYAMYSRKNTSTGAYLQLDSKHGSHHLSLHSYTIKAGLEVLQALFNKTACTPKGDDLQTLKAYLKRLGFVVSCREDGEVWYSHQIDIWQVQLKPPLNEVVTYLGCPDDVVKVVSSIPTR